MKTFSSVGKQELVVNEAWARLFVEHLNTSGFIRSASAIDYPYSSRMLVMALIISFKKKSWSK